MIITAKYPSTCGACHAPIPAGSEIEWTKGQPARHAACVKAPAATKPAPAAPAAPKRNNKPSARAAWKQADATKGEIEIRKPSRARGDNYCVGDILHLVHAPATGGGDDKRTWVVVHVQPKYRDEDEFDAWMCSAIVRPATTEEAAPRDLARGRASRRKELESQLRAVMTGVQNQAADDQQRDRPAGRSYRIDGNREWILAEEDGQVVGVCEFGSTGYDEYRPICCATRNPRAAEILTELLDLAKEVRP